MVNAHEVSQENSTCPPEPPLEENSPPPLEEQPPTEKMSTLDEMCELQHLMVDEEGTPPVSPGICKVTQTSPTTPNSNKVSSSGAESVRGAVSQGSLGSRSLNRIATAPSIGATSSGGQNTRLLYVNEKLSRGPSLSDHGGNRSNRDQRPSQAPRTTMKRGATSSALLSSYSSNRTRLPLLRSATSSRLRDLDRSCQHHCFLTDVTDVHRMEAALLHLLEDFHSGKLRAFGKNCSMEQMTGIREQQERLARLHFDLGAQGELYPPLSDEGLRAGQENMRNLMGSLEQLSISIERLHSFSETREGNQQNSK